MRAPRTVGALAALVDDVTDELAESAHELPVDQAAALARRSVVEALATIAERMTPTGGDAGGSDSTTHGGIARGGTDSDPAPVTVHTGRQARAGHSAQHVSYVGGQRLDGASTEAAEARRAWSARMGNARRVDGRPAMFDLSHWGRVGHACRLMAAIEAKYPDPTNPEHLAKCRDAQAVIGRALADADTPPMPDP